VLGILVDRAWAVQQLVEVSVIGALGTGIDGVDRVIRTATMALSAYRALRTIVMLGLAVILVAVTVIATVLIVTAAVAVVVAPVFMTVIVATLVVSRASNHLASLVSAYPFAVCISSPMVVGLLQYSFSWSYSCQSPLVKATMASVSVMLGTKFLVSEKCLMKSCRDSSED